MMNYRKLLKSSVIFFFLIFILTKCSKEEKPSNYIAQVKDEILTEAELNDALGEYQNQAKYKEEYIQEWIEREVLYQKALDDELLNSREYLSIINRTKRELAASLLINRLLEKTPIEPNTTELKKYYDTFKEDFKLTDDSYRINIAYFLSKDSAIKFRALLIESSWDNTINAFKADNSVVENQKSKLYYGYQLQPITLQKIVENLSSNEVSIVFETEPMKFAIVQYLDKYINGNIPPFEIVQNKVHDRYVVVKQKELVEKFKEQLMADYNTEIKRYHE